MLRNEKNTPVVTPMMHLAGMRAFIDGQMGNMGAEGLLEKIYLAMEGARAAEFARFTAAAEAQIAQGIDTVPAPSARLPNSPSPASRLPADSPHSFPTITRQEEWDRQKQATAHADWRQKGYDQRG